MAAEPIDTVAIRLVADASTLLEEADAAVEKLVEVGEEAGQEFSDAFGGVSAERFKELSAEIADFAEAFDISFVDAAKGLTEMVSVGQASREELMGVAEAMSEMGDLSERADKVIKSISETMDFLGKDATPEASEAIEEFIESLSDLESVTTEEVALLEEMATELGEVASEYVLAEDQVKKVVDAFRELGLEIPNALKRDQIRKYVRQLVTLKDQFSDVEGEANKFTDSIIEQGKKMTGAGQEGGFLRSVLGDLGGGLAGLATNAIAAFGAFQILKTVFNEIKEATKFALEFTEVTRDLAMAVRVNTVAGDENILTFQQWQATAEEISKDTSIELRAATETVTLALRELGSGTELTDDQIQELIVTGSKFADLYGQKLPSAIRQATAFINRGYAEALNNLGLELGKQAQNQKAFELGLGTNIDKLSESQQEFVRYVLLLEEMSDRTEALGDTTATFADRLDEVDRRTEAASLTLGNLFAPVAVKLKEFGANVKEGFTATVGLIVLLIQKLISVVIGDLIGLGVGIKVVLDNIGKAGFFEKMAQLPKIMADAAHEARFELLKFQVEQTTGAVDEYADSAEVAGGATEDLGDAVEATTEQISAFIQEAQKFDEGVKKIARRLQDALADITRRFNERRAKAEIDLQRDLADIDQDSATDRMMTVRQFMIDEIRLREDHAKDIRQLEERFLLDLEDAVRDRDARRVLSLQRRFNMEKKRREEDFGLRNKRLREDFREELRLIEFQRQRRRAERMQAFNEEMADLAAQQIIKEEEARLRADRAERELLAQIEARLKQLVAAAEGEIAVETEKLDALLEALIAVYGPEGPWVLFHEGAVKTAQGAAEGVATATTALIGEMTIAEKRALILMRRMELIAARAGAAAASLRTVSDFNLQGPGGFAGRQRGGTIFATSPTSFSAGEGRPERIDITPLSTSTGKPSAGFGGDMGKIQIQLDVSTSEMLVIEVADQTMNEMADIFVDINQRGFQGGRGA